MDIWEKIESRENTNAVNTQQSSIDIVYGLGVSEDDADVDSTLQATISAFWNGLPYQSYHKKHVGGGYWEATVHYGAKEPKKAGDQTFSFDTTGGTVKLTKSLGTHRYTNTTPIENDGNINVQKDGNVEGVEITIPKFAFNLGRIIADPLPDDYVQALYDLTGKVNNAEVTLDVQGINLTFQPGEVLFKGATGEKRSIEDWRFSLHCDCSKNAAGLSFSDITGVAKKGWEYLWVQYRPTAWFNPTPRAHQVNVERVYETADLNPLFE